MVSSELNTLFAAGTTRIAFLAIFGFDTFPVRAIIMIMIDVPVFWRIFFRLRMIGRNFCHWLFSLCVSTGRSLALRPRRWKILSELTHLERDEHVARWIALTQADIEEKAKAAKLQSSQPETIESKRKDGKGHRRESGVNAAARELGVKQADAHRAKRVVVDVDHPQAANVADATHYAKQ